MLELPLFGEEAATQGPWRVVVPAPYVKPVRKRKTGKVVQRKPWLNSNDRDHWRVIRPITADWRANAAEAAKAAGLPTGLERVRITAHVVKARAGDYDAGNFYPTAKAVVDGLIDHGMCVDDNNRYVEGPFLHPGGKGEPALVITVERI
ncbi:hypothetical protein [Paenarthrobacter ureafaciens]|uniref:hypothetical protein n=1 Tax=Paenarthrobacter ureafaciens TaxID=37931 RepID=UPI0009AE0936|nr:hypothetical protein [Paenarthrobacter ureafaciens]GLU58603.1 hypothetical protein Pure01_11160 [Paenarthrobacter ureafaciens]GLU61848.1 hypothetical protein Pure02_00980 [Paenarthrobacter ureafaciens]GLU66122.1 hypothetical protein Pure03_00980 [Paenarthrobacter ureafaciens]GLU71554.1 hypothetical protein Pure04_12690 [Paenarthrobacter ureafaciens]GLU74659.1 hypothetical protein Pure05_00990 [Paenarthrobacter ureafaciens]